MGFDFYAPQTFLAPDGRRLLIAWMGMPDADYHNPTAALGWQHCLTLPREVFPAPDGRLCQRPARELEALCGNFAPLPDALDLTAPLRLRGRTDGPARLALGGLVLDFDPAGLCTLSFADDSGAGRDVRRMPVEPGPVTFDIWVDRSGVEVFLNGGRTVAATRFYPPEGPLPLRAQGVQAEYAPLACPKMQELS